MLHISKVTWLLAAAHAEHTGSLSPAWLATQAHSGCCGAKCFACLAGALHPPMPIFQQSTVSRTPGLQVLSMEELWCTGRQNMVPLQGTHLDSHDGARGVACALGSRLRQHAPMDLHTTPSLSLGRGLITMDVSTASS